MVGTAGRKSGGDGGCERQRQLNSLHKPLPGKIVQAAMVDRAERLRLGG